MELKEIGIIESSYKEQKEAPRQGRLSNEISKIKIHSEFSKGIKDIKEDSYILVLYFQDRSDRTVLETTTPFTDKKLGVFSTRSPNRPNPIALCLCEVIKIEENTIFVKNLDGLDNSPVIDIKPYSKEIDSID